MLCFHCQQNKQIVTILQYLANIQGLDQVNDLFDTPWKWAYVP